MLDVYYNILITSRFSIKKIIIIITRYITLHLILVDTYHDVNLYIYINCFIKNNYHLLYFK